MKETVIGIDLAGSEKRNTGIAILNGTEFVYIGVLHTDKDILKIIKQSKPNIVAIDAPLTLPKGRKDIEQKNNIHFRQCDSQLRKLGIRFFPITLGPMRMLTIRGIHLKKQIEKQKIKVIEVFPGASYDMWKINRKDKLKIISLFRKMGFKFAKKQYTQDETDAICCAITARLVIQKNAHALKGSDGCIWIPNVITGNI